jgi:2,3-dihydroxybenzoate decarboxylase
MNRKIALEEHFAVPETVGEPGSWTSLEPRLLDFHDRRLSEMDQHGIELAVLSLNGPSVQGIPSTDRAVEMACRTNDVLAEAIAKRPDRLRGFAALPMQDPSAAIAELTRAVRDLGFAGAMVNGFSEVGDRVVYYDDPAYLPFWAEVERLDVPFFLHPRLPLASREPIYDGHPWFMGASWAFAVETAMHALRLMGSGLFDRHPGLNVILGHLGEGLPYNVWRLDHWLGKAPKGIPAQRTMAEYLRSNFFLTTSGNFRTPTLVDAIAEVGGDRVLFSVDYPFEDTGEAARWFDAAQISDADRLKIGRTNAARLFKIA